MAAKIAYSELALAFDKDESLLKEAFTKWCKVTKQSEEEGNKLLLLMGMMGAYSLLCLYIEDDLVPVKEGEPDEIWYLIQLPSYEDGYLVRGQLIEEADEHEGDEQSLYRLENGEIVSAYPEDIKGTEER